MPQIFKLFSVLPLPTTSRALLRLSTSCFWFNYTHKFTDHLGFFAGLFNTSPTPSWSVSSVLMLTAVSVSSMCTSAWVSSVWTSTRSGSVSTSRVVFLQSECWLQQDFLQSAQAQAHFSSFYRHWLLLFYWPTLFNNKGLTCSLPPGHCENVIDIVIGKKHQIKTQTNTQEHTWAYQECNGIWQIPLCAQVPGTTCICFCYLFGPFLAFHLYFPSYYSHLSQTMPWIYSV